MSNIFFGEANCAGAQALFKSSACSSDVRETAKHNEQTCTIMIWDTASTTLGK